MGLSLKNLTKKIGDVLGGVERQVNPFDNGATYSNPHPAAPAQPSAPTVEHNSNVPLYFNGATGRPVYSGSSLPQSNPQNHPQVVQNVVSNPQDTRNPFEKLFDQVNPVDNGRTFKVAHPRNKSSVMQQVENSGAGHVAAPIVNVGKSLVETGVHTAGIPVEAARAGVAQVTGDQAAQDAAAGRFKSDASAPLGLVRAVPVAAYQLGESLNPTGGDVYNRTHTFQTGAGKFVFGADPIPSMQTQYKQDVAEHGKGYAMSAASATAVMDALGAKGGPKAVVKARDFVKSHDAAVGGVMPKQVDSTVKFKDEPQPTQVKPLPSGKVNDNAAARQAVLDAHNPVDNTVQVPIREGKVMGEGGLRDQFGGAMVDTDAAGINTLRHIEKKAGVQGLVSTFIHNTNMLRNAPKIAQHAWENNPYIQNAIGGLNKTERAEFADYTNARAELKNYGTDQKTFRTPEENKAIVQKYHDKYGARFDNLNAYYRDVVLPQAVRDGRITQDTATHLSQNRNYVHLSRDMEDLASPQGQGKSLGLGKSKLSLKRTGSARALHDPVAASLEYAKRMETERWKNVTGTHLVDTLFRHGQATKLVDSEHVLARQEIRKFLSNTREGKNVVDRALKTMSRKLRVTQREVDALNKEGLDISLKPRVETRTKPDVQSRVKVTRSSDYKQVVKELKDGGRWKPVKAASVNEARTALRGSKWYNAATKQVTPRLKAFAEKTGMTEDQALVHQYMKRKGVDAYINHAGKEVPVNIAKLERHAGKMASEGRFKGKVEDVRANTTKMGTLNTKRAVEHLMSVEPSELTRIKNKLANREPKLAALIDHVEKLRNESEAFHTARRDAYLKARGLSDQVTKNKNTITIQRNGAREVYEVSKDMKKLAEQLKPFELNGLQKGLAIPARALRGGATAINPVFAAANPIKDLVSSAVLSKDAVATHSIRNIARGVWESGKNFTGFENHPLWHEFEGVGGDMTQYDLTRNAKGTRDIIERVAEGRKAGAKQAMKHLLTTLEDANSITEKATRFQNFKGMYESTLRKAGLSEEEIQAAAAHPAEFAKKDPQLHEAALVEARTGALENTINFNRAGSWGRMINLAIPYSNAAIQGGRQLAKSTRDRPLQTIGKGAAWVGTPIAAATLWNTADPERKKVYENIDNYEKQNNLVFVVPGTSENDVKSGSYKVVKIPLPPDIGSIFQPVRQAIEKMKGVKGRDGGVGQIASELAKPFTGPVNMGSSSQMVGSLIPQALKPGVQQAANRDFYTGKQIVPAWMTDANSQKKDRSYTWTSDTAKLVGKALNVEPVRVDKFVKDMFGTTGAMATGTVDNIVKGVKKGNVKDVALAGPHAVSPGFVNRFGKASAKVDPNNKAATHFTDIDNAIKNAGLDKNELSAYNTLHPMKVDGAAPDKTPVDGKLRADIYMKYDKVWKVDQQADAAARKRGEPGNPMFDLNQQQRKALLAIQTSNPGDPDAKILEKDNPWLQDYYKKSSQYFDQVMKQNKKTGVGTTTAPDPIWKTPVASDSVNRAFDAMNQISDSKQRSQFIRDTPELQDYLSRADQATRAKRAWIGLEQFDTYPTADKNTQSLLDQYDSLPQHDGKRGGNKSRYDFIQAHPEISDYFNQVAQYSANEDAKTAMYQGHDNKGSGSGGSSSGSSSGGSSSSSGSSYSRSSKPYVRYSSGSSGGSSGGSLNTQAYVVAAHGQHAASFQSGIKKRTGKKPAVAGKKAITKPKVTIKRSR